MHADTWIKQGLSTPIKEGSAEWEAREEREFLKELASDKAEYSAQIAAGGEGMYANNWDFGKPGFSFEASFTFAAFDTGIQVFGAMSYHNGDAYFQRGYTSFDSGCGFYAAFEGGMSGFTELNAILPYSESTVNKLAVAIPFLPIPIKGAGYEFGHSNSGSSFDFGTIKASKGGGYMNMTGTSHTWSSKW